RRRGGRRAWWRRHSHYCRGQLMPMLPMPTQCSVTGGSLLVTKLECEESGVTIEGCFTFNEFAMLFEENFEFLRIFVKVRGNFKEVERILGLSYSTIRLRFEKLLLALGYEAELDTSEERAMVLDMLEKGELDSDEAVKWL